MKCEHCGGENVIPIWYSKVRFLIGADPDHYGCVDCRELVNENHGELGVPDL